ncbi:hypothetical protein niasHS_010918 [Heterodera schachtii]|uniref:Uncharacterized protein n=1 Tax=Heterodera schachtii TaxID=97005 RepID=A0ABD2IV39_HETSC
MDKENKKRKGTKRSKNPEETLKQREENQNKENDDEFIHPPRRRSARLIAISKPALSSDLSASAEDFVRGKGTKTAKSEVFGTDALLGVSSASFTSPFNSYLTSSVEPIKLSSDEATVSSNRSLTKRLNATNVQNAKSLGEGTSKATLPLSSDDDGEEDEWGAMELLHTDKTEKKVIEVELDEKHSDLFKRQINPLKERDAKEAEERAKWEHEIELEIMRKRREFQEGLHRFHFLTFVAHLRFMAHSLLRNSFTLLTPFTALFGPISAPISPAQMGQFLLKEFRSKFRSQNDTVLRNESTKWCVSEDKLIRHLLELTERGAFDTDREISLLFFALCSFLMNLHVRICVAFNPMPKSLNETVNKCNEKEGKGKLKKEQKGNDLEEKLEENRRTKRKGRTETKAKETKGEGETDRETAYWNEYWDEEQRRWICVDPFHCLVDEPNQIEPNFGFSANGTHKILYVLAIDSEKGVREIGAKYIDDYLSTANRKLRTDGEWVKRTMELEPFRANQNRCRLEEAQIHEHLKSKPMPTVMAEFKNHPLYALKKDLLKFEAIYPPDTPPIGHIGRQRHEVFPRSAVHKLEGSLNWIKETRSIKAGEKPYKIVSARPKLNIPKEKREPLTLDLFGYWQTEPYVPAEVTADGRIPRNEFGNIYMYKAEMLPKGCVHLRLPGVYLIARRMDLEAVPAVIGWEFSGGFNHPILDGCVVLRKDEEILRSAWAEMAREKAAKTAKRMAERVWKNWRRLIRGKMLLEQMRTRFSTTSK